MSDRLNAVSPHPTTIWSEPSLTDWISAGAAVVSTVVVIWALIYARQQVYVWRTEARHRRRAEVAEDVLATAHGAADVLRSVRSPFSSIPVEEADNKTYIYEQRGRWLTERGADFEKLRHMQFRAKAVLQDDDVDNAVEKIFEARARFWSALQIMVDYAHHSMRDLPKDEAEMLKKERRIVFGGTRDDDEISELIGQALEILDNRLGPIVRLDTTHAVGPNL